MDTDNSESSGVKIAVPLYLYGMKGEKCLISLNIINNLWDNYR